jgi:hypothetical protein
MHTLSTKIDWKVIDYKGEESSGKRLWMLLFSIASAPRQLLQPSLDNRCGTQSELENLGGGGQFVMVSQRFSYV